MGVVPGQLHACPEQSLSVREPVPELARDPSPMALLVGDDDEDVEPFGGSVSVLAGLLSGAGLVVVGAAGVARRHVTDPPNTAAARGEVLEPRLSDRPDRADDRARQRADQTRIMRTVAAGLP